MEVSQSEIHSFCLAKTAFPNRFGSQQVPHSWAVGRVIVGLLETRTCRRTAEPLQGEPVLRVKNENHPLKSSLVQKDRGGIA